MILCDCENEMRKCSDSAVGWMIYLTFRSKPLDCLKKTHWGQVWKPWSVKFSKERREKVPASKYGKNASLPDRRLLRRKPFRLSLAPPIVSGGRTKCSTDCLLAETLSAHFGQKVHIFIPSLLTKWDRYIKIKPFAIFSTDWIKTHAQSRVNKYKNQVFGCWPLKNCLKIMITPIH